MSETKRNSAAKRRVTESKSRNHHDEFAKKIIVTLVALLLVYVIVWVGVLTRNSIKQFSFIGKSDVPERIIAIEGTGTVQVRPDVAMTTMGLRTEAETVALAQEENSEKMNTLIASLKNAGIPEEDIQTINYNVREVYDFTEEEGRVLVGHEVSQQVRVRIRDVAKASRILALAGEVGANNVGGLQFTIDDRSVYLQEARTEALKQVREKAMAIEASLGVDVGEITSYSEWQDQYGQPAFRMLESADAFGGAPSIEAGQEEVVLNVSVGYQLR